MEKKCFVIMPISDHVDYPVGHFGRVYEYIIKPACETAGFKPLRADEVLSTNYIAIDILKHIVQADMAICDLSSKNPNVLYELGIRQAFNLPVTFIKDKKTNRIFDIQGFRDVEYDENLRIDMVNDVISEVSETIKNTYENRDSEVNSLISYLGIEPAKIKSNKITGETQLILNFISNISDRLSNIEDKILPKRTFSEAVTQQLAFPYLTPSEIENLKEGDIISHARFGNGILKGKRASSDGSYYTLIIDFNKFGEKSLVSTFAKLYRSKINAS